MESLSSRERLLRALSCQPVDHTPCCFMLLHAMDTWFPGEPNLIAAQADWGLDPLVVLPSWSMTVPGDPRDLRGYQHDYPGKVNVTLRGLPVHCHTDVRIREWRESIPGAPYPVLQREYLTPAGPLHVSASQVTTVSDLKSLAYLLLPPDTETIARFRAASRANRERARERDLLLVYQWGVLADMAAWLCGLQELVFLTADQPTLVAELLHMIADWNLARMQVVLDAGIDLWVRRGWYEGSDFWSPGMYRQFILPHLKKEVETAHARGVKFGYIMTTGAMPLLDMILEAGVDVLLGVDPVQGGYDLRAVKAKARGRMCLWGGVNGSMTVEAGTPAQIRRTVQDTLEILAPDSGFILSPVDGIYDTSERTKRNLRHFVAAWKDSRSPDARP